MSSKVSGLIAGHNKSARSTYYGSAALAFIAILPYALFYAPVLYEDDWTSTVWSAVNGNLHWVSWMHGRPLELVPRLLIYALFGLNIHIFYLILFTLNVLGAILLYLLGRRIVPSATAPSWIVAALFLVYPADFTRTYLTMISIKLVLCLALLFAMLTLIYVEDGRPQALIATLGSLFLSLGVYEGHLGLILVWCLWILVVRRGNFRRRIVLFAGVTLVTLLFVFWRIVVAPRIGLGSQYIEQLEIAPSVIVDRLLFGLRILVWGWTIPVGKVLQWPSTIGALLVVAGMVVGSWMVAALAGYKPTKNQVEGPIALQGWTRTMKRIPLLFGGGVVLALAGYLPIVTVMEPNLTANASRVNLFATLGASVMIAVFLWTGSAVTARTQRNIDALMISGAVPLLLLGMAIQAQIQRDIRTAWNEQQAIWHELFEVCPNFEDNTAIYFVLPGYQDRHGWANWQRTPLSSEWEVTSALQVLYHKNSLHGDLIFSDLDRGYGAPEFTPRNIASYWTRETTAFSQAVFVSYDGSPRHLRVIQDLRSDLQLAWEPQGYAPMTRCLQGTSPRIELRRLVTAKD